MTLEEAIRNAEEVAAAGGDCCGCRAEHGRLEQFAAWLKELRALRAERRGRAVAVCFPTGTWREMLRFLEKALADNERQLEAKAGFDRLTGPLFKERRLLDKVSAAIRAALND